ncbi:MAG TPA: class A beta-lactamase [Longimicrobiaceae bacterium]|nr:class A beta-lactamase [Longimicrobiaceae bacterium]
MPRPALLALLLCAACAGPPAEDAAAARGDTASAPPPAPRDTSLLRLERDLAAIAAEVGEGSLVGIAAIHLESGERVAVSGDEPFTMMSVYKFPVALAILRKVERGALGLDQPIPVGPLDLRPGYSPLAERDLGAGGITVPVRELVRLAVAESDNTAGDLLFRLAGGGDSITAGLRRLGIEGVRVDREEGVLAADYYGIAWTESRAPTRAEVLAARPTIPAARRREATARFPLDPRDTATPEGMAELLAAFAAGRTLGPEATGLLREIMVGTATGPNRLKALLPPGTVVAHKTGTSGSWEGVSAAVNDVGIVALPGGGSVAVAVFVRNARGEAAAERAIARAGHAVYDHWAGGSGR